MIFSIDSILEPLYSMGNSLLAFFPKIIAALSVILVGLLISWAVKRVTVVVTKWTKLDKKLSDIWVFRLWSRDSIKHLPSQALSNFVYYSFMFIFVLLSVKILGGKISETILNSLYIIIPGVLSFMLILFLGTLLAMFLSFVAQIMFMASNFKHPSFWGKVVAWTTFGILAVFSLEQLGVVGKFLNFIFVLVITILGAAVALSFGLGCKDIAREFVIELLKKNKIGSGKE